MRSLSVGMVFVGCLAAACGSASNSGLFGSSSESACGSSNSCGAQGGAGSGSPTTGGAANVGGQPASGGSAGGTGEEASGGHLATGGTSDTGGAGGQGSGTGGNVDAGVHTGTGGSQTASCPEGDYHAVLMGSYTSAIGTRDVGATIDFSVSASGAATGTFSGPGGAKATVTGTMDCSTGALTSKIEDGTYQVGFATTHFSGTFDGTYYQATSTFGGMWTMTETGSTTNGGNGPWSTQ